MSAKGSENWKWHLWRKDRKTNLKTYCEFFYDEKGAIESKKQRSKDDPNGIYAVLDYGPLQLAERAKPVTTQRVSAKPTATQAMAEARAESRRRDAEQQKRRSEKAKADKERKEQNDKDMAGIRADAAGLVEKHKRDEAADLEQGINR